MTRTRVVMAVCILVLGGFLMAFGRLYAVDMAGLMPAPPDAVAYSVGQDPAVDQVLGKIPLAMKLTDVQSREYLSTLADTPAVYYRIAVPKGKNRQFEQSASIQMAKTFYLIEMNDPWIAYEFSMNDDILLDGQRYQVDERISLNRDTSSYTVVSMAATPQGDILVAVRKHAVLGDALVSILRMH